MRSDPPSSEFAEISPVSRLILLVLAAGFILASLGIKLLFYAYVQLLPAMSPLATDAVVGTAASAVVLGGTWLLWLHHPFWVAPWLQIVPRASLRNLRLLASLLLVGGALFAALYSVARATAAIDSSWLEPASEKLAAVSGGIVLSSLLQATWEELTFRGWPFAACVQAVGPHSTALSLGALFGLAHLLNEHWTMPAIFSVSFAGWLLSYLMLLSRAVSAPIGLHGGWNITQSLLTTGRFWRLRRHPSPWLSGGRYGLEASAAGLLITGSAAAVVFALFTMSRARADDRQGS